MSRWYLHPEDCQCTECKEHRKNTKHYDLSHLSTLIINCPTCGQHDMRWDTKKDIFVCWNCCKVLASKEGLAIHDSGKTQLYGDGKD